MKARSAGRAHLAPLRRWSTVLLAALLIGGSTMGATPAAEVVAAPSPVEPGGPTTVTADALPTAQINGIAWSQAIVGNTVYVGGKFSSARPPGAAPGTGETPRGNLLSYTLSTGLLTTSFAPTANAQVLAVAASPDGSRVYVGGDFTQINGQPRSRIAAFSTASGALISSFAPPVGYQVRSIVATNSTVYVGGSFSGVGSQPRSNLAAFSASNGALLGWAPRADRQVNALTLTADGRHVIAGGMFESINGSVSRGLVKLDAVTGAPVSWPVAVSNAGPSAGITSLTTDGAAIYGTAYHYGPGGNVEGPFSLDSASGALRWVADCHGDTYSAFAGASVVYAVGHAHYCGNVGGGFPQYSPWRYQHSMAFTKQATGTNLREVFGYASWQGRPSPSIVQWLPSMTVGNVSGAYQAGWHVTGNSQYVVIAGEFPRVNGTAQQGLVRFATKPTAPSRRGPAFLGGTLIPSVETVAQGAVKVGWMGGYDQDDRTLTYEIVRTPGGVVHSFGAVSSWWQVPALSWTDRTVVPGTAYSYQIRVTDGSGNRVFGATRSITPPTTFTRTAYGTRVLADGATSYWPLNGVSGTLLDHAGANELVPGAGVTRNVSGAIPGDSAIALTGNNDARVPARGAQLAPDNMSVSAWFRTTATAGRVIGFGDIPTGNSGHRDRQVYLSGGRVVFQVQGGGSKTVTSSSTYNNNQWHQVVATLSGSTMTLYVDGARVAQRTDVVEPEVYVGQWRLSGDAGLANFAGSLDEVALFPTALTATQVRAQYVASGRG